MKNLKGKSQKGITLVALVVTIVILIILATVSVSVIFGESGLIKMAERAKDLYESSTLDEEKDMNELLNEYENMIGGTNPEGSEGETDTNTETPPPTPPTTTEYNDKTLPSTPKISEGMQRVMWDETSKTWKKAEATDNWYDYSSTEKKWANVVLGDATWKEDGVTLDEEAPYTQLVWIPRYAYKISSGYHQSTAGTIDIKFIDTSDKDTGGTTYQSTYPTVTTGTENKMNDYVVHPAFNYGETKLPGFWVGKFESSHSGCTTTASSGEGTYETVTSAGNAMTVKAGVTSWRSLSVGDMFKACIELNNAGNIYGLSTDDNVVDPHLMKNSEWGAVAYLSKSVYGKNDEIWINPNSNYITGQAGSSVSAGETTSTTDYKSENGKNASTTGNTSGVYDMSGGAYEYVAAFVNSGTSDGGTMVQTGTAEKYVDKYTWSYTACDPTNGGKYGEAVYETSNSGSGYNSWYSDSSIFPITSSPYIKHGGFYGSGSSAGTFNFDYAAGSTNVRHGFRVVVPVL